LCRGSERERVEVSSFIGDKDKAKDNDEVGSFLILFRSCLLLFSFPDLTFLRYDAMMMMMRTADPSCGESYRSPFGTGRVWEENSNLRRVLYCVVDRTGQNRIGQDRTSID